MKPLRHRCVVSTRWLKNLINEQERVITTDDPKGRCAAYHRGQIAAYRLLLAEIERDAKKAR
jgi:hypothetical protein